MPTLPLEVIRILSVRFSSSIVEKVMAESTVDAVLVQSCSFITAI